MQIFSTIFFVDVGKEGRFVVLAFSNTLNAGCFLSNTQGVAALMNTPFQGSVAVLTSRFSPLTSNYPFHLRIFHPVLFNTWQVENLGKEAVLSVIFFQGDVIRCVAERNHRIDR